MANLELLTATESDRLDQSVRVEVGKYHTWNPVRECEFVIELDARQLANLIEDAAEGRRVYEFMSIRRPGDVLPYLTIRPVGVDEDVLRTISEGLSKHNTDLNPAELPFVDFDRCFHWDYDDTPPHHHAWLTHRRSAYWPEMLSNIFEVVRFTQARLRQQNEYILQHELRLIDTCRHRRDYLADWRVDTYSLSVSAVNVTPSPEPVRTAILELIRHEDIRSVSCPFDDFVLWRGLVGEQLRRAEATGLPLQQAFCLCGPDSGLSNLDVEDWGGEVHIPYEGACGGDLFILPRWHRFFADKVRDGGKLRWAVAKPCNHVLLHGDHGELACATRSVIGDWTLYSSTAPHEDCNPFLDQV